MAIFKKKKNQSQEEDYWSSVSDLMSGLMMVFLFISIALMREAMIEKDKIKDVAVSYQKNQVALYDELHKGKDFKIEGIEFDSRKIKDNYVFVAMIGSAVDGHNFIQKAINNGAKMIIVEKKIVPENYIDYENITFIFSLFP